MIDLNIERGVILMSGGLDSTTLAYYFIEKNIEFVPLIINYGQHCFETEFSMFKKVLPPHYLDKL
jgi:7-cyano-7-deazaguanine synthase